MADALYKVWQQNPDIAFEEAITDVQQAVQYAKFGAKLNYLRILKGQCPQGYEIGYFKTGGRICKKCVKKQEGGSVEDKNSTGEAAIKEFKRGHKMKRCAVGGATDSKEMNVSCPCHKKKVSKKGGGGDTEDDIPEYGYYDSDLSNVVKYQNGNLGYYLDIPSDPNFDPNRNIYLKPQTGGYRRVINVNPNTNEADTTYYYSPNLAAGVEWSIGGPKSTWGGFAEGLIQKLKSNLTKKRAGEKAEQTKTEKEQDGGILGNKDYNDKFMSYSAFTPNSGLTTLTDLFKDYYM